MKGVPMIGRIVLPAVCAAVLLSLSAPAEAQRYRARTSVVIVPHGLYVGGGLVGTRIVDQRGGDEILDHGFGFTLYTGLRLNPRLALELGWLATFHNPERVRTSFGDDVDFLVLNGFTGDAKIFLDSASPSMEPYLQGGLGLYLLDSTYFGAQSVGTGFQLGGGVDFRVAPAMSVGVRALYRGMAMGPPERVENDTFVSALTLDGNLTVHF
jgi:hypothetical protein